MSESVSHTQTIIFKTNKKFEFVLIITEIKETKIFSYNYNSHNGTNIVIHT